MIVKKAFPRTEWKHGNNLDANGNWRGAHGWNSFWSIWSWDGIARPVETMAQERAEWGWRHRHTFLLSILPLAVVLALAAWLHPAVLALAPISYLVSYLVVDQLPVFQRRIEFFGHAVSVVVAQEHYGVDQSISEQIHVNSIVNGGYSQFRGVTNAQVIIGLRGAYPAARAWARDNRNLISGYLRDVDKLQSRA